MTRSARADRVSLLGPLFVGAILLVSAALWALTAEIALAFLPMAATTLIALLLRAPPYALGIGFFFLGIVADNPQENPAMGLWETPLKPIGLLLYENLNNVTGISALRFAGLDLLLPLFILFLLARGHKRGIVPVPRALSIGLLVMFAALVALELWGLMRGGNFKASLWQARTMLWIPAITYVFVLTLRGAHDLHMLALAVLGAGLLKLAEAFYFYNVIMRPLNQRPAHATTHSDTVLFVAMILIGVAYFFARRTMKSLYFALAISAAAGVAILINNRRLAYVGLAIALGAFLLLLPPSRFKKSFFRSVAYIAPFLLVYVVLGWGSSARIFAPVQKIASLFSGEDRSAGTRDIENYNLLLTWQDHLITGSGFGHEYKEVNRADRIDQFFALYRYIGHNSVLWLFSIGGLVGFSAIWMPLALAVFFGVRGHDAARSPDERAASLVCVGVVILVAVQAYGDMGIQSCTSAFFLALALALSAKLAVASGALS